MTRRIQAARFIERQTVKIWVESDAARKIPRSLSRAALPLIRTSTNMSNIRLLIYCTLRFKNNTSQFD